MAKIAAGGLAWVLSAPAWAGSGPWTLQPGEQNIYLGADYFRYDRLRRGAGSDAEPLAVGVSAGSLTGVATFGLAHHVEAEFKASFEGVRVTRPDDPACSSDQVPEDWCDPTSNVGDLGAVLKWRVLDELNYSPVSLSLAAAVRSGETYANTRGRLTTLGDGGTDVGAQLSLGRTATFGSQGWYQVSATAAYWYRFPNVRGPAGKAPADDLAFDVEGLVSPYPRIGFGPVLTGFQRLGGQDLTADTDFFDVDAWNRLQARSIKVGGKLAVYSVDGGPTVSLAVLRTVHAVNNPADTLAISMGIGWFRKGRVKDGS